ncbi:MAG: cyclic nucleotide-binding domain-containing protein [Candidatus Omnitrophica bacterium]|nr:cyclic nucleotide-binding domain-containing protein [Candidatus Omnitrophota bacterium]
METLETIMAKHDFLSRMKKPHLKILSGCASNVVFKPDQYIFHEGERADRFYLIRAGKVAIEIRSPEKDSITIDTVGQGEVIGWSWLVPPYRWHFDARAVELTRAIALDGRCLRTKCERDHDLGYELLKRFTNVVVQRLSATRLQLLDLYGNPLKRSKK